MTPREFAAFVRGKTTDGRTRLALSTHTAWATANFMFYRIPGKRRLPDLARLIRKITGRKPPEQTVEEQLKMVTNWTKKFGGQIRKMKAPAAKDS